MINLHHPRVIPFLLLAEGKLVKTVRFGSEKYVGDPVNVVSIFNDFQVDEIVFADISRSRAPHEGPRPFLERIVSESFVPLAFGGGIQTADDAESVISIGVEKVVVNSLIFEDPKEVVEAVKRLGSQAVVASVDVRKNKTGVYEIWSRGGTKREKATLQEWCATVSEMGVGEVLVTNIDREGTWKGIDLELVNEVTRIVRVPVIAHGGAGDRSDLLAPIVSAGASAVAAGSLFLFKDNRDNVLINYPSRGEVARIFNQEKSAESENTIAELPSEVTPFLELTSSDSAVSRICVRCIVTDDVPGADFDALGVCAYCHIHDRLEVQYPQGPEGDEVLDNFVQILKRDGTGKKYDCILGVSGGTDSSYLAHILVHKGVRVLAVHFDNTWNTPVATSNIYSVLGKLKVDLETYVVDNDEYDDIYLSFMKAGVKDIEAPTDIGFMGTLYRAADKHGIKHIVEGHSFRTEGISPLGWLYMDGGYVKDVHKKFGTVQMRTYPNMSFWQFIRWSLFSGIKRTRPLYWIDYKKESVKRLLEKEYGWEWYGGHHLENRFSAFYHSYFLPTRFAINFRQIEFSALVRSGQMDRAVAVREFGIARVGDPALIAFVKKRLRLSDQQFDDLLNLPHRSYVSFSTYKRWFELFRPLFWVLLRLGRVPESFYLKFCKR